MFSHQKENNAQRFFGYSLFDWACFVYLLYLFGFAPRFVIIFL